MQQQPNARTHLCVIGGVRARVSPWDLPTLLRGWRTLHSSFRRVGRRSWSGLVLPPLPGEGRRGGGRLRGSGIYPSCFFFVSIFVVALVMQYDLDTHCIHRVVLPVVDGPGAELYSRFAKPAPSSISSNRLDESGYIRWLHECA